MALIKCENLKLGYDGKEILQGVSFEVNSGDYLAILGSNGSGKTTLMKTVLGLLTPLSGKITYGDGLTAKEIGYLPQQTEIQRDFPASVREIVRSGCVGKMGLRPFYTKNEKSRADEAMELLGISGLAKKSYRNLSGGQQQRVLLARALCATEKLLLLDEPVTGLDPHIAEEFYAIVDDLNKNKGITVIMISHDLSAANKYATRVIRVDQENGGVIS